METWTLVTVNRDLKRERWDTNSKDHQVLMIAYLSNLQIVFVSAAFVVFEIIPPIFSSSKFHDVILHSPSVSPLNFYSPPCKRVSLFFYGRSG